MDARQALDLIAELPGREIAALWEASREVTGHGLGRGLWLGRNGGMASPLKWFVRAVVKRDYFAKLVLDGYGINVRVRQDGSHQPLPSPRLPGGVKVDLPFALTEAGLDYGFHLLGFDAARPLQLRDVLRSLDLATLAALAPEEHLARVGASRNEPGDGELILGYIVPLAIDALRGAPFGMVWHRAATAEEEASATAWLDRRRLIDSSIPA
jgi:hypothetical protein